MMMGSSVNAIRLPNTSACCPQIGTTLKSNSRIPLNKRICKREPSFQVGSLSCIRSIQFSRYIPPISFQIFFFFQRPLTRGEEIPQSALFVRVFKHVRLPKPYCVLRPQHLPCRCFSLFIAPEWYSGAFSRKSTFLKISLPLYLPYFLQVKDQGWTKEERRNDLSTPYHQKVLFIKIWPSSISILSLLF